MRPELFEAYERMRRGETEAALALLMSLTELTPAEAARAHAWRGQALRALGRPEEGARAVIEAIRAARAMGDTEGVSALRALHAELAASVAAGQAAEAGRRADAALVDTPDDSLDADTLLRKAGALHDAGRIAESARCLALAGERATSPRDAVLVHLARARLSQDPAEVHAAHRIAEASDDQNLLTAVAHAARALGIRFAPPSFG